MDQKTVIEYGLWLFACERFCRFLLYHTKAIFCWSSLAQRSATLRSHSRLISSECFHRRNASSCVIFLISIMVIHLISIAKLNIISE